MQKRLIKKISQYIDAGFPILYINSFEDDKIDSMIEELGMGKEILEWNGAKGWSILKPRIPSLLYQIVWQQFWTCFYPRMK